MKFKLSSILKAVLLLAMIYLLFTGYMYFSNRPSVLKTEAQLADTNIPVSEMTAQKNHLYTNGFPSELLSILPDSEFVRYQNFLYSEGNSQKLFIDGGNLKMDIYFSIMKSHKSVRVIVYYKWITPPQNTYTDVLHIDFSDFVADRTVSLDESSVSGCNYMRENNILYKFYFKEKQITTKDGFYLYVPYQKERVGQWGYYAFNLNILQDTIPEIGVSALYYHQNTWRIFKESMANLSYAKHDGCTLFETSFLHKKQLLENSN